MRDVLIGPEAPSRRKRWARRAGILGALLLVAGLVGEMVLRTNDDRDGPRIEVTSEDPSSDAVQLLVRAQTTLNRMAYAQDPELGALLAPALRDLVETVDFTYTLETDHAGFPNPEPWPDHVDVAVLGNSLLVGPGVGMEGQFTTLLERRLEGRRVLNLGLPGAGTEHSLLTYRRFVKPLDARLVIVALWVVWDVDNSLQFALWQAEGKPDPDYTRYRYTFGDTHPGGGWGPRATGSDSERSLVERAVGFVRRQLGRSRVVSLASDVVGSVRGDRGMAVVVDLPRGRDQVLSTREQERLALGLQRSDAEMEEVFFGPLERLSSEVEAEGGRFVVALVPSKEEVYGAEAFPGMMRSITAVRAGLESRRLPVLDLYPVFEEVGREEAPYYRVDMHLNELGNELVADALTGWIAEQQIF